MKLEKFVCSLNIALMRSRETYDTLSRCNCVYLPSALKMLGRRTNFMVVTVVLNFPISLPEHRTWSVSCQWASSLNQRDTSHRDAISDRVWHSSACLTIPNSVRRKQRSTTKFVVKSFDINYAGFREKWCLQTQNVSLKIGFYRRVGRTRLRLERE